MCVKGGVVVCYVGKCLLLGVGVRLLGYCILNCVLFVLVGMYSVLL